MRRRGEAYGGDVLTRLSKAVLGCALAALLLALAGPAPADEGWRLELEGGPSGPGSMLVISKDRQELFVLEQKSPLRLAGTFSCTTGQARGDKFREGDMRTPEGVYFVEYRRTDLDYDLYGSLAYTLNFPNPVDRLKGKTGSGIWIHGRGRDIVPRETKGCVALNLDDLKRLEASLEPGLPVLITRDASWSAAAKERGGSAEMVARAVLDWAEAWRARSPEFFSFYDAERFAQAQGMPFAAFRRHKERLFERLPWLELALYDVHVVPGPDYWVTYFGQYYRTASLDSQGVKRLYWMLDDSGAPRIVGKEWNRGARGLEQRYLADVRGKVSGLVESWRDAWAEADLGAYLAFYAQGAQQDDRAGLAEIRAHKETLWQRSAPKRVGVGELDVALHPQGLEVGFRQDYAAVDGYSDTGYKTLVVQPEGDGWRIVSESWRPLR